MDNAMTVKHLLSCCSETCTPLPHLSLVWFLAPNRMSQPPMFTSRDLRMVTMTFPTLHSSTKKPDFQMKNCRGEPSTKAKAEMAQDERDGKADHQEMYSWQPSEGKTTAIWQLPVF